MSASMPDRAVSKEKYVRAERKQIRTDDHFYTSRGFRHPVGETTASVLGRVTFSWVAPLLDKGSNGDLHESTAGAFMPPKDDASLLSVQFWHMYHSLKKQLKGRGWRSQHLLSVTLLSLHWPVLLGEFAWTCAETALRVASPVVLRFFVRWLANYKQQPQAYPQWQGWVLAVALGSAGFLYMVIHHQGFWFGMHLGFQMRQQVIAVIYDKVLRLNSATVADVTVGKVVNLVSSDVRRLDDIGPFWVFLINGPVELAAVTTLIAVVLGVGPAFAGVACLLMLIPVQAVLTGYIKHLRRHTAHYTDERVRLSSEVISGALAVKMLAGEKPYAQQLHTLRQQEMRYSRQMARIRACNMAFEFLVTPLATFITFTVARATNVPLSVWDVFFAVSLLHLPKLTMATFFTRAAEVSSELVVCLRRINDFLSIPEPSNVDLADVSQASKEKDIALAFRGADFDWHGQRYLKPILGNAAHKAISNRSPNGDHGQPKTESGKIAARKEGSHHSAVTQDGNITPLWQKRPTLQAISLQIKRGELVAIVGAVGSGKSSLLAALLGEMQPLVWGPGGTCAVADPSTRPVMTNNAAYCSQIPWIVSGTVRSNILFGLPMDLLRYERAVRCVALAEDIAQLPAGDETELGERGINLSGGQKARVALARAVYSQAAVVLLDDPLSAVDARVGATIFNEALGPKGVLRDSTRLLVTHQRQYLPYCDRIVVLRDGAVYAVGSYSTVAALGLPEVVTSADDAAGQLTDADTRDTEVSSETVVATSQEPSDPQVEFSDGRSSSRSEGNEDMRMYGVTDEHDWCATATPALDVGDVQPSDAAQPVHDSKHMSTAAAVAPVHQHSSEDAARSLCNLDCDRVPVHAACAAIPGVATGNAATLSVETHRRPHIINDAVFLHEDRSADLQDRSEQRTNCAATTASDVSPAQQLPQHVSNDINSGKLRHSLSAYFHHQGQHNTSQVPPRQEDKNVGISLGSRYLSRMLSAQFTSRGASLGSLTSLHGRALTQPDGSAEKPAYLATRGSKRQRLRKLLRQLLGLPAEDRRGVRDGGGTDAAALSATTSGKLVIQEATENGGVSAGVYGEYFAYVGWSVVSLVALGLAVGQVAFVGSEYWLASWARADSMSQREWRWVWGYATFVAVVAVCSFARSLLFYDYTLKAATKINMRMVQCVLRAPLSFFHTNPSGRILNRFSKDQSIADEVLPQVMFDALQSLMMVAGAFVLVSWAVPVILPTFIPLALVFIFCRNRYVTTSREVKRLESTTRSPVYASFSATLKGLPTIRAYHAQSRFAKLFNEQMDANGAWWYCFISCARWVGVRLDFISACTLLFAAVLMMLMRDMVSARMAGLALTHVLGLSGVLQWMVRQTAESENNMTSVERMLEYTHLDSEPPLVEDGAAKAPSGWPSSGEIVYQGVSAVYRAGLPPVLQNLSFTIRGGNTCGVVGRTGSGKSSLLLTLFRLLDLTDGSILIDNVDISSIGLDVLRGQLAIIPQDPVLFSGTLRGNLDPWDRHPDARLWEVLQAVKLDGAVGLMGGLGVKMADCGDNFSVGQRQLLCLARSLLQDCAVMALDEATANIDRATDALIQQALRDMVSGGGVLSAKRRTLLVIAHRINTILDCDQLLVLAQGQLLESGSPSQLIQDRGHFAAMVRVAAQVTTAAAQQ